jgi:Protein of unknown function (DUF1553)/Protein of unknown function (DUF1549)/Bacterial Ig-like domain (group 2)
MTRTLSLLLFLACGSAVGGELAVHPPTLALVGPNAGQQIVVTDAANGRAVADLTAAATFTSGDPKVAVVDKDGRATPTGNGTTTITVTANRMTATAKVTVTKYDQPAPWSFTNHVVPILTRAGCNSGACHGALAGKGGFKLSLRGYDPDTDHFVMTRQALGRRVDTSEPAASLLIRKATRQMPHGGGSRIEADSDHHKLLLEWVRAGAAGPTTAEATLTGIEVFPPAALLKPKDTLRVVVRATYSDGRTADVTRLARFSSTEETVAEVDEDGRVTVSSPGETAIAVLFGTKVATATVTVPYPNAIDPAVFDQSPKHNHIDANVLKKLRLLNLPPSPPCTDAEFVRRAFLDTCGILPKPAEVTAFVNDKSADKRAKLIDTLLARPEFVDYWTHKWSNLLLVSTRKLSQQSMLGFYRTIRSGVADNQPWDRFARDILTASGSTLSHGGGNYFVLHKDVSDLVESTAVTFLGTSITCARCHNHPLERWTQDQYWGLANLFSRVGIKNGDRTGEQLIQSLPAGDALHPRKGVPMTPTPLDGTPLPLDSATDRREHFVAWLIAPENPYFAKAIVNRIWRNYMGRGLVEAEDDLRDTNPPTNRDLLDTLAADFVAAKFDTKHLMRMILNSAAYQRSSKPLPANEADDRFYSRYLLRRLPAEVILDAYSDVTGVPTPFDTVAVGSSGGTAKSTLYPAGTRAVQLPDSLLVSQFLDSFGRAERSLTCSCETTTDSSVTQALHLNNGKTLNDKLKADGSVVKRWVTDKTSDAEIVDRLFATALGRPPTDGERKKFVAELAEATKAGTGARREVIEDVIWAVLSGKEFLFNH